jgi:hypothetical protein
VQLRTRDDVRVGVLDLDQGVGVVTRGRPDTRLPLSAVEVERLSFADLDHDRERLLGLRPAADLEAMLAARGA